MEKTDNDLVIKYVNGEDLGKYNIDEILLNGQKLRTTYITHREIQNGGTLQFNIK